MEASRSDSPGKAGSSTSEAAPSREELKKRLRDKMKKKRSGGTAEKTNNAVQNPKEIDFASLLMSMGVDDADILKEVSKTNNPQQLLGKLGNILQASKKDEEVAPPGGGEEQSSNANDAPSEANDANDANDASDAPSDAPKDCEEKSGESDWEFEDEDIPDVIVLT
jgi:hypothetical protein